MNSILDRIAHSPDVASDFIVINQEKLARPFKSVIDRIDANYIQNSNHALVKLSAKIMTMIIATLSKIAFCIATPVLYGIRGAQIVAKLGEIKFNNFFVKIHLKCAYTASDKDPEDLVARRVREIGVVLIKSFDYQRAETASSDENLKLVFDEIDLLNSEFRKVRLDFSAFRGGISIRLYAKPPLDVQS